ncbi:MAG: hypothetical protein J2P36_11165, partial [Ktedonobacteraceae bacterium]|nr:hypothetical protein [Ktedonobacteraceae bacterium]
NRDMRNILIENKGRIRDRLGRPTGQIRAMLEEGKIDGSFNPELSTGLMLISFMSLLTFSSWEQFISQERFSPEELIDQVGRIFFEGIKRK